MLLTNCNCRVVCNINEQILDTNECWGFGPGEKVDNMVRSVFRTFELVNYMSRLIIHNIL